MEVSVLFVARLAADGGHFGHVRRVDVYLALRSIT